MATYFAAPQMENAIFVNKYAERFCNETKRNEGFCPTPMHDKTQFPLPPWLPTWPARAG